jgi:hypothetical protein
MRVAVRDIADHDAGNARDDRIREMVNKNGERTAM